jgi:dolichol-phosphate mannosyltransferase
MATLISIIVPVFNEGNSVFRAYDAIRDAMSVRAGVLSYEVIFVDDGSEDDSFKHLTALASRDTNVRVIKLASNCGSHMAIRAGLEHARGSRACFLACDLQEPPELIPQMFDALTSPVEIVWAVRESREDTFSSKLLARIFYWFARRFVSKNIPPSGASMFMLGPDALRAIRSYNERNLTLEGLFATLGLRQAHIHYHRQARVHGTSKWTVGKRLKLFADFFVAYSYTPIRSMSYLGIVAAALGFVYALVVIVNRLFLAEPIQGWSSLVVVVLVMSGLQMIMMGVIGEYLWRTLDEVRRRPRYIIDTILNDTPDEGRLSETIANTLAEQVVR